MAQKKRKKKRSIVSRLRARIKQKRTKKSKTMAYGRNRRRFNPFRSFRAYRQKRRQRRSYGRSYSRPRSGGFSRRMPILGIRIPSLIIWLAIIGGALFFGKDALKPLIDKFTKHNNS